MSKERECAVCGDRLLTGLEHTWAAVTVFDADGPEPRVRMHVECLDEAAEEGWDDV